MALFLSPISGRLEEMANEILPELVSYHSFKDAGAPVYKDSPEESEQVVRKFLEKIEYSKHCSL